MGLFTNPLGYAGYPPDATAPATVVNSTVRAATVDEANSGTVTNAFISPATEQASIKLDFASPPVLGFGSTTPRPVAATTITANSTISCVGSVTLATGSSVTTVSLGANATSTSALTVNIATAASGTDATVNVLTGNATAGTQTFNALTGTRAGVVNIGTGAPVNTINLGGAASKLGTFGATATTQRTVNSITNSAGGGGTAWTISATTSTTDFSAAYASINGNFNQIGASLVQITEALRAYGLGI